MTILAVSKEVLKSIAETAELSKKKMLDTGEQSKQTTIAPVLPSISDLKIKYKIDNLIKRDENVNKSHIERTFKGD